MADQGDNDDALLNKLDSLIRSGRAQQRRNPPPLLTEAVPEVDETSIPTLTDAVEADHDSTPPQTAESATDSPAIDSPAIDSQSNDSHSTDVRPADVQELVASRLLAVVDREMASLVQDLPAHEERLSVLHRSIRFALPELVKIRWQEAPEETPGSADNGSAEPQA